MVDTSETCYIGSCSRRDREAGIDRWPDQLGLPEKSDRTNGDYESVLGDEWCETMDSDSNKCTTRGDDCNWYGSISRASESDKFVKNIHEKIFEGTRGEQETPTPIDSSLSTLDKNKNRLFSIIFYIFGHRANCGWIERRRDDKPLLPLRQRSIKTVWILFISLMAICSISFGFAIFHNGEGKAGIASLFLFDNFFRGMWRTPTTQATLDLSPTSRSILLVLRAEVTPPNPIVKDIDRQLTANGIDDAVGLGIYLNQHNIPIPEWIFVSPTERTAYTTELMRRNWAFEVDVAFEEVLYVLEFNDYFTFVAGLNDHFRRIMIVGHNPAILNTAKILMKTHGIEDFPDCGLLEIEWNDLKQWKDVQPNSGSSTLAIDPNNNFFFSSPEESAW